MVADFAELYRDYADDLKMLQPPRDRKSKKR
jgi:hypothetical protein